MRAGLLRYVLTLEAPSETAGDAIVTWTTQATVRGELHESGGDERSGIFAEKQVRFNLRYRADLAITPRWRIGIAGTTRKFNIAAISDPDGRKREWVIVATELV